MDDGFALRQQQTAVKDSWQYYLGGFLHDIWDSSSFFTNLTSRLSQKGLSVSTHLSTLQTFSTAAWSYRTMPLEYKYAEYLTVVKRVYPQTNRRLPMVCG